MAQMIERNRKNLKPYISIFFATRKRVKFLDETLHSIYSLADSNNINFEVIIKIDFDDIETIDYIKNHWTNSCENIYFIISSRKEGWLSITDFSEDMIDLAKGKYVWTLNDDSTILTKNWNTILESKLTDFKIYFPYTNGYRNAFWCIPKEMYNILGHVSLHNCIDTYLHVLAKNLNLEEYIDEVCVFHKNDSTLDGELPDVTTEDKLKYREINFNTRDYHYTSVEFQKDITKLQNYIENINYEKTSSN